MAGSTEAGLILWRVVDTTERDLITVHKLEIGGLVLVLEGEGALYQAIAPGVGSACWSPIPYAAVGSDDVGNDTELEGDDLSEVLEALDARITTLEEA